MLCMADAELVSPTVSYGTSVSPPESMGVSSLSGIVMDCGVRVNRFCAFFPNFGGTVLFYYFVRVVACALFRVRDVR